MNRGMMALQKLRGGQQGPGLGPVSEPPVEPMPKAPQSAFDYWKDRRTRIEGERAVRDSQPIPEISLPRNTAMADSAFRGKMDSELSSQPGALQRLWALLTGRQAPASPGGDLAEGEPDDRSSAAMFGME